MPEPDQPSYQIQWMRRIAECDRSEWDALALGMNTPFLEWDWLNLLETSGSITPQTGWHPRHLAVFENGRLKAAAPLYIKTHSHGEFVFDHAWAELAGHMGIDYYPKLVGMIPVTPVTGYRFLTAPDVDEHRITRVMVDAIDRFCRQSRLSGCSFLFVDPGWRSLMSGSDFASWTHQGFAWSNPGDGGFDDYLARFNANQRRNIRRERKALRSRGITVRSYAGDAISRRFFALMYDFYRRTNDKFGPWGCKYLTGGFFEDLHDRYRHRLVTVAAFEGKDRSDPVGMSLLVHKNDQLFGRYWGSLKDIEYLHFDVCYYEPIRWAIANGIRRFDPGLGGPHKLRRGFTAVPAFSLHRFTDRRMQQVLRFNIDAINRIEQEDIDRLNRQLPFTNQGRSVI